MIKTKILRIVAVISAIVAMLGLQSCGFHLRSPAAIPPEFCTLHLETPNNNLVFSYRLAKQLKAMHIHLVPEAAMAPFTLSIVKITYTHDNPAIITSNIAVTYTFTLTITVELLAHNHIVTRGPRDFSASGTITLNPNQVLVPGSDNVVQQELQREVITLIYYWLISPHKV